MKNVVIQSSTRRDREKAELRGKILDTARAMFAAEGYEAVTMRGIAKEIGYTATALYYHFPDKHSLLVELCNQDFLTLAGYLQRIGRIADPVERVRKMGLAYVNFGMEYPQHYRLMFMTPQPVTDGTDKKIEKGNPDQDAYAFLQSAVAEAHAAGSFRKDIKDPELVSQMFWASVHGIVALHLTKCKDDWIDWRTPAKTAQLQTDALFRGLLK
jgi:AcrR family transcriptional regulator